MIALLLAALFQSAAPASTATAPSATPVKAVAQADKRGPVCRKETVVGSTIKKKICPRRVEEVAEAESGEKAQAAAREP
jgi:hypothetical protein